MLHKQHPYSPEHYPPHGRRSCRYGDFYNAWKKSYIYYHNARNSYNTFQNSVTHTSRNHNDELAKAQPILIIGHNYSSGYFLHKWAEFVLKASILSLKNIDAWFTKRTFQNIFQLHISAFILCVHLVTSPLLWRHKDVAIHVTNKTMHQQCMVRYLPLRGFAGKVRLCNV